MQDRQRQKHLAHDRQENKEQQQDKLTAQNRTQALQRQFQQGTLASRLSGRLSDLYKKINNVLPSATKEDLAARAGGAKALAAAVTANQLRQETLSRQKQTKKTETASAEQALTAVQFAEQMKQALAKTEATVDEVREGLTTFRADGDGDSDSNAGRLKAADLRAKGLSTEAIQAKVMGVTVAKALALLPVWERIFTKLRDSFREKKAQGDSLPLPTIFRQIIDQMAFSRSK